MEIKKELMLGRSIYDLELRVVYYARVSTDLDIQSTSIVNQVDYFEKFIDNISGWIKVGAYIDEGISGKSIFNRLNFQRMINDGLKGNFDLILTKSVSRFARNTVDSIKYTDLLRNNGVGVYFINDNINTFSNDSEFRLTLMASIAQDEIRKLSESVKFGLKQSIERGVVLGNSNILGYKKNKGKLILDKKEAVIVKDIYNLFIKLYNYSEVARIINKKYNKNLDSTSVKRILTNYKYKGYYCGRKSTILDYKNNKREVFDKDKWLIYKDIKKVPPIVNEELWDLVNNIIAKKKKNKIKKNYIVICNNHKRLYKYITKKYKDKEYKYYICNNCNSLKEDIIKRMILGYDINKIYVTKYDNYCRVYCQIKP